MKRARIIYFMVLLLIVLCFYLNMRLISKDNKLGKIPIIKIKRNPMAKLQGLPTLKDNRNTMAKLEELPNMKKDRKATINVEDTLTIKTDQNSITKLEAFLTMKSNRTSTVKKINFWNSVWRDYNKFLWLPKNNSSLHCGVNHNCQFYSTKSQPLLYDALVFHGWHPQEPPSERLPHQAYIMFLRESPAYRRSYFVHGGRFYNWSITYSLKSDFVKHYFYIKQRKPKSIADSDSDSDQYYPTYAGNSSSKGHQYNINQLDIIMHHSKHPGEAFVFWVVSHCSTHSKRERYVDMLKRHLAVDIYGKCGQDCRPLENSSGKPCHEVLAASGQYKFYLAFENSACRDYVTEKVFYPLNFGLVPIVLGGLSMEDYTALLPPGSFIDVRNFTSPKYLAEYLLYLDKNDKAYLAYHVWREEWEVVGGDGGLLCKVCRALYNGVNTPPKNIDWGSFWNPQTDCDNNLLEKIMSSDLSFG